MKHNIENELQYLRNALDSFNLKGYTINQVVSRKYEYFLADNEGTSLTGYLDYVRLNHFILGYGKAYNKFKTVNQ